MTLHGEDLRDFRPADELAPDERMRLQRAWRQRMLPVVPLLSVYIVLQFFVDLLWDHQDPAHDNHHPPTWVSVLVVVVALAVAAGTLWWSRRRLYRPGPVRTLVLSGERGDRIRVARAVRRRRELEPDDRVAAQAVIDLLPRQLPAVLTGTIVLVVMLVLSASLPRHDERSLVVLGAAVVLGVLSCGWVAVSTRRSLVWAAQQGLRPRRSR